MSEANNTSIPDSTQYAGYLEPLIGQKVNRDVIGYFGFPIIGKGELITREIAERAYSMARLYELQAAVSVA